MWPLGFSVTYLEDSGVVEATYTGTVTPEELDQALTATGTLAAETVCNRFLIDARDQDPSGGSAFDILRLAEFLASLPPGLIDREAILSPPSAQGTDDMHFFETAARNRGLNVLMFTSREDALVWLAE